jgi:hypothetical protein
MVGYRITVRSLERKLVGEQVLNELASLEDASMLDKQPAAAVAGPGKVVFVLEDEDGPFENAPRRPE